MENQREGGLGPLDNFTESTNQYVSGMANEYSLRVSLNYTR